MHLPASKQAWGSTHFAATLKSEVAEQADELPLQQALSGTSAVASETITVVMLDAHADGSHIQAKVGVFFAGILAGCSCADDPTQVESQLEYCELILTINRLTAATTVSLLD